MRAAAGQDRPSSAPPELTYHHSSETLSKYFYSVIHCFRPECEGMWDGFTLRGHYNLDVFFSPMEGGYSIIRTQRKLSRHRLSTMFSIWDYIGAVSKLSSNGQEEIEHGKEGSTCSAGMKSGPTVTMQTLSTPTSVAHPCSCLAGPASAPGAAWLGTGWGWGVCKSGRRCRFIKELRLIFMWPARTPGVRRQRGRESVGMNCGLFCWGEKGITMKKNLIAPRPDGKLSTPQHLRPFSSSSSTTSKSLLLQTWDSLKDKNWCYRLDLSVTKIIVPKMYW